MDKAYIRQKEKTGRSNLAVSILKGLLVSVIIGAIAMLVFCAVAMKFDDPDKVSPIFGVATLLITSFFGGLFSARFHGQRGFSTGALFGFVLVLIVAVASLISGVKISTLMFSITAPVAVLTAALGGIAGASERKTKKKKRKH